MYFLTTTEKYYNTLIISKLNIISQINKILCLKNCAPEMMAFRF